MLRVWIAGLAITLLAGCGGSGSGSGNGGTASAPGAVPGIVTGLTVTAGDGELTITWDAVAGATSYNLYRSTSQGSQGTLIGSSAGTSYTDSTVANGATYSYVVTAVNAAGESPASAQSAPATPAVALSLPSAPTGVGATAANGQVTLTWNAAATATSYQVYRSTTQGQQGALIGSSAGTNYTDATAANGTTYYYAVSALNAAGASPPSAQSSGATPTAPVAVPAAPAGVTAVDGVAQVTVSWTGVSGAISYKVYRSTTQGQQGTQIGSSTVASFTDIAALDGTAYHYRVSASNAVGEGPASAAVSVTPGTSWTTVKMGGGGYVPGIIYHPTVRHLRYARTDVAGVYRWDNDISSWTALTDAFGRPDGSYQGAESMALDPTDPNRVYMTASMAVQYGNGRFYYSSNQGRTWDYVTLPFPVGSNNQGRAIGERLMVDPNQPSTLFYASRTAGLWKSTNRGLNWSQVTSLSSRVMTTNEANSANGGSPIGVEFVVFGATVPTSGFTPTGSPTSTIYVGVAPDYKSLAGLASYLYKSSDGGATWSGVAIPAAVTTALGANDVHIPHLARAADGMLYVPFTAGSGPGSSGPSMLYKFDGSNWALLISSGDGRYYGGIGGLAVYGTGATTKIAFGVSGTWGDGGWVQIAMRSADGGVTWQEFGRSGDTNGSLNYHDATGYWGWADDLEIDPFDPDHISYVLGGGIVSTSEGFSAALPRWQYDVNGIEEMINLAMAAPPPGAPYVLVSAHGDTGLYVHTSLTASPNRSPNLGGGNGTGVDMAWNNPAFIVGVGTFGTSKGAYSTDAGVTWSAFPTVPPVGNAAGDESKVAVTADGAHIIWAIAGQVPYYTTNRGGTWTATNLPAPAVAYHLVADRKNPLKVYAYDHGGNWWYPSNSAKFYYSTDGGRTFTAIARTWGPNGFSVTGLAVNPFVEGDLWLADANSLWHSVDSGLTWTQLTAMATVGVEYTNLHGATKVALGAPAPGSGHSAAIYLVGAINGKDAVYRSADMGATWVRIDDDNHRYGGVNGIAADTSVYGRVFMRGRGMNYNN
jgi:fibronectin type 3 domain-containing protein